MDVLAPEGYGEIIGGSQRVAVLRAAEGAHRGAPAAARSLLVVSRPAPLRIVPHGGFGMGIERVVAWICGLEHVRETIPFRADA